MTVADLEQRVRALEERIATYGGGLKLAHWISGLTVAAGLAAFASFYSSTSEAVARHDVRLGHLEKMVDVMVQKKLAGISTEHGVIVQANGPILVVDLAGNPARRRTYALTPDGEVLIGGVRRGPADLTPGAKVRIDVVGNGYVSLVEVQ